MDDIIIAHTVANGGEPVKRQLLRKYKMTDLGTARKYLGIEIHQSSDGISLCQQEYANKVLRRFRMENSHDALSPMDPNVRLTNTHCEDKPVLDRRLYLSIVGSLMYAALGTRPDLSFCVTALSRYNTTPLQMHLTAAKRALRYLKRTASYRLHYPRRIGLQGSAPIVSTICGFSDSDWAGNEMTRKSVGGCIFFADAVADRPSERFPVSGAIHWQSRSQTVVALSTLEAEYIACSDAVREAIWVRRLLRDMATTVLAGLVEPVSLEAVRIGCDNQGALKLIDTGVSKQKTKHIDIKYHHIRDEEVRGYVRYHYVKTTDNPADLLTKALPTPRHNFLVGLSGLLPSAGVGSEVLPEQRRGGVMTEEGHGAPEEGVC